MPLDVSSSPLFNINEHAKNGHPTTDVRILADTLMRFKAVHVDPAEFACLKAIVLFRAGINTQTHTTPTRLRAHVTNFISLCNHLHYTRTLAFLFVLWFLNIAITRKNQ